MTRYSFGLTCVLAFGVMPMAGCGETNGGGGNGGSAGSGGSGGTGGGGGTSGNECTVMGACVEGECITTPVEDGTTCGDGVGTCRSGRCSGTFACTEAGIREAIAVGGGPHTFDCDGPTTVVLEETIEIDNDVELDGEGNLILEGRGVYVVSGITAALRGMTIQATRGAIGNSGALTLTNMFLTGNRGCDFQGCGLSVIVSVGPLTVRDSTVSRNIATGYVLLVHGDLTMIRTTITDNSAAAALYAAAGALWIQGSTISGNETGISVDNGPPSASKLIDSTVSNNERYGIRGSMTVINSTIVGSNVMRDDGNQSPSIIRGTVISGNCESEVVSDGYNLESPGDTCGFDTNKGDLFDVTAEQLALGPLQDNGGPTMTHALLPGSVAIDAIPADACEVNEDQRGVSRPQGPACDIGAFELEVGR